MLRMRQIGNTKKMTKINTIYLRFFFFALYSLFSVSTLQSVPIVGYGDGSCFNEQNRLQIKQNNCLERLNDIENRHYQKAVQETKKGNWESVYLIIRDMQLPVAQPLIVRSMYETERYEELMSFVENLNKTVLVKTFEDIIGYYLLASISKQKFDNIAGIMALQNRYYPDITTTTYKRILYSLIEKGNYEPVIEIMNIFPPDIYLAGEKNYILGIVNYHLGNIVIAKEYFDEIPPENQFKRPSYNYLSLIDYYSDGANDPPEDIEVFNDEIKFNYALSLLKSGKIDEASSLSLDIEQNRLVTLLDLFIAWEMGHFKTVAALIGASLELDPTKYSLTSLIAAESYYHTKKYREAETMFKIYKSYDNADLKYANHALGYCFEGYYRFNNTAYYWIKNIENTKTFYDSLATYNLSLLYNHTQNYDSAQHYFKRYIPKYGVPDKDQQFISSYLNTLFYRQDYSEYKSTFDRYGSILPKKEKLRALTNIGTNLIEQNDYQNAILYLGESLEIEQDDKVILQLERAKLSLGEYEDSENFTLALIEKYPNSSFKNELTLDLAKFYLSQNRFATTISFIDTLLVNYIEQFPEDIVTADDTLWTDNELDFFEDRDEDELDKSPFLKKNYENIIRSTYTDSLIYLKGNALEREGKLVEAALLFVELNDRLSDIELKDLIKHRLNRVFDKMDTRTAFKLLTTIIENEESDEARNEYLLLLAKTYEKQFLYAQANSIYHLILESGGEGDEQQPESKAKGFDKDIYYSIAVNEMRQKNYQKSLEYINTIQEASDKVTEDVLFLSYLAHYSLGMKDEAINILLSIYESFPQSPKRFEVIKNIVEQFIENKQSLFAWYFLNEYYPIANDVEKWALDQYREMLSNELKEDTLAVDAILKPLIDMGIDIQTILADSLFVEKDGEWHSPFLEKISEELKNEKTED